MAADLAATPVSGLAVQACGDAHLSNFGLYASPERALVFDLNDFDETLPGPWEWDVKRLAARLEVAGRDNGYRPGRRRNMSRAMSSRAGSLPTRAAITEAQAASGGSAVTAWHSRFRPSSIVGPRRSISPSV
jgi:uncharacterized protein (DUF2252 family)